MISTKSIIKEVWLDEPITTMKEQFMNSMLELNIKKTVLVTLIKTIEHFSLQNLKYILNKFLKLQWLKSYVWHYQSFLESFV